MRRRTWIKICGVTLPEDIELVCAAGADAVGFNFVTRSKRRIEVKRARELAQAARGKLECVGVVEDLTEPEILELIERVGLDRVQLHGSDSNALVERLGGHRAYTVVGISAPADVELAESAPGSQVLVDARDGNLVGGTGTTFDWGLIEALCRSRATIVAGGLCPTNVANAIEQLHPFGVDVASGVEAPGRPGIKSPELVHRFVEQVRRAESGRGELGFALNHG